MAIFEIEQVQFCLKLTAQVPKTGATLVLLSIEKGNGILVILRYYSGGQLYFSIYFQLPVLPHREDKNSIAVIQQLHKIDLDFCRTSDFIFRKSCKRGIATFWAVLSPMKSSACRKA